LQDRPVSPPHCAPPSFPTRRSSDLTAFHPCGTCKMGSADDDMAVVDGKGRVYGLEGLRVVDASIMPLIITGNLNATTIMIGEKIADHIRGREPLPKSTADYYVADGAPVRKAPMHSLEAIN